MPVPADPLPAIVLDSGIGVHLPVDKDLFAALLVLKPDLIKSAATHGTVGLDPAARLVRRQFIGRHCVGVVDAPDHDGTVRIPFSEPDNHLMADARNKNRAPLLTSPHGPHTQPARTVAVILPRPIPMELHLHASVLVGEDLLAARSH